MYLEGKINETPRMRRRGDFEVWQDDIGETWCEIKKVKCKSLLRGTKHLSLYLHPAGEQPGITTRFGMNL